MAPIRAASEPPAPLEDPLNYLLYTTIHRDFNAQIVEYRKGQVIYNQDAPSTNIYVILKGRVKVSRLAEGGRQVIVNIYQTKEFFGESALVHLPQRAEVATALENTKLMTWTASEVEELAMRQPRLGIAFLQMLAQRTTEFARRIESLSTDNVVQCLARCLIRLSERMGTPQKDWSVKMVPFHSRIALRTYRLITGERIEVHEPIPKARLPAILEEGDRSLSRRHTPLVAQGLAEAG